MQLDPPTRIQSKRGETVVTNEQIRRARPSVDSPLGRLLRGEIDTKQYEKQIRDKHDRESDHRRQAATSSDR